MWIFYLLIEGEYNFYNNDIRFRQDLQDIISFSTPYFHIGCNALPEDSKQYFRPQNESIFSTFLKIHKYSP